MIPHIFLNAEFTETFIVYYKFLVKLPMKTYYSTGQSPEYSCSFVCVCVCVESMGLRSKVLRKIDELKSACVCTGVPDEFLCPITRELMRDPVIAAGWR